jgi:hypothetical protein
VRCGILGTVVGAEDHHHVRLPWLSLSRTKGKRRWRGTEGVWAKVSAELAWACGGEKEMGQKERWAAGMEIGSRRKGGFIFQNI